MDHGCRHVDRTSHDAGQLRPVANSRRIWGKFASLFSLQMYRSSSASGISSCGCVYVKGPCVRFGVVDRDLDVHVPDITTPEAFGQPASRRCVDVRCRRAKLLSLKPAV